MEGLASALGNAKPKLLVIDISGSMQTVLGPPSGSGGDSVRNLISMTRVNEIAVVDSALVAKGRVNELTDILSRKGSGATNLGPAVKELLKTHGPVLVLTDEDGAKTLGSVKSRRLTDLPFKTMASDVRLLLVGS